MFKTQINVEYVFKLCKSIIWCLKKNKPFLAKKA